MSGFALLEVEQTTIAGVVGLLVRGELDLTSTAELEEGITALEAPTVVLDLTYVAFIDSAGMRAVELAHRRLAAEGRRLLVVAPPGSRAAWTFRIAGLGDGFVVGSREVAASRITAPSI